MSEVRLIYVTVPKGDEARKLARKVVEERVVACANIFPEMESLYWWSGNLENTTESVILFKTTTEHVEEAMRLIRHWHPYDTPCILTLPVESGDSRYLDWLQGEVHKR